MFVVAPRAFAFSPLTLNVLEGYNHLGQKMRCKSTLKKASEPRKVSNPPGFLKMCCNLTLKSGLALFPAAFADFSAEFAGTNLRKLRETFAFSLFPFFEFFRQDAQYIPHGFFFQVGASDQFFGA